jgi:TRAP-type C4-dicarboxylate transport system substrate-binding protein
MSLAIGSAIAMSVAGLGDAFAATKLKLASEAGAKGSPVANSMDLWAELIEKNSDGEIKVSVFYQGELGGQQELFDQLIKGNIDMMLTWPITSYDPRMGVVNTPYLVLDWGEALEAYKPGGWVAEIVDPVFQDVGLKYFGPYPEGFGGVATKGRHATTPQEAEGIKVRSQPIFPFPQAMQALGYEAVPIDWNEVYTSIQTGVVDGDSGNVIYWDYEYFGDLIEHYVHTRHIFSTGSLLMSLNSWNDLSEQQQKIVIDAAVQVVEKQFQDAEAEDLKWRNKAIESGINFVELNDDQFNANVKAIRDDVWPQMDEKIGKTIMNKVRAKATSPGN